ncbi:wax ester/triacylglycerol synthase family O-acyltransferase [Streptomyces aureocirculatus]|uniref:wax ester/triacylglycerol synthase family O-acyltransferase n=1 Tax=Streptomyces aureocirculatus TaxID=67275 RepID=UPI0004C87FE4|nr:wax ester/triacylglycerol synthase family O-acyltransferase [Streptomyces aureocirculatus]
MTTISGSATTISGRDRMFLAFDTPRTRQHVAFVATLGLPHGAEPGHLGRTLWRMRAAQPVAPPFNYRLPRRRAPWLARAWEVVADSAIDLRHHVRCHTLRPPGDMNELARAVSLLHSSPLDPARPLWEMHLIGGLNAAADEHFALYFKFHHALLDGEGCLRRLRHMLSADPADDAMRPLWGVVPAPPAGAQDTASRPGGVEGAPGLVTGPGAPGVVTGPRRGEPDDSISQQQRRRRRIMPFTATRTVLNGRIGPSRAVAMSSYDLDRLRRVAGASGATVNEVLLAVCGSGLRVYLNDRGELPRHSLSAGVPMSVREPTDLRAANVFTLMVIDLATDVADPVERLRRIVRASDKAKSDLRAMSRSAAERHGARISVPLVLQHLVGLAGRVPPPYNVVVSNVPGRGRPSYFLGAKLKAVYALGSLCHGTALFMAACSSNGRLHLTITADRDTFPDLRRLRVHTDEALDELTRRAG